MSGQRKRRGGEPRRTAGGRKPKLAQVAVPAHQGPDGQPRPEQTFGDRVLEALRIGSYISDACAYAGISKGTVYEWVSKGQDAIAAALERAPEDSDWRELLADDPDLVYAEFSDDYEKARADAIVGALGVIRRAALGTRDQKPQWQAAAWFLERTRPNDFGRRLPMAEDSEGNKLTVAELMSLAVDEDDDKK